MLFCSTQDLLSLMSGQKHEIFSKFISVITYEQFIINLMISFTFKILGCEK
jgi:hypothetical protein